jgi:hypothetical protein
MLPKSWRLRQTADGGCDLVCRFWTYAVIYLILRHSDLSLTPSPRQSTATTNLLRRTGGLSNGFNTAAPILNLTDVFGWQHFQECCLLHG